MHARHYGHRVLFTLLVVSACLYGPHAASAATSGPNSPGTAASNSAVGTKVWTNPSNAAANDGVRARAESFDSVACGSPSISQYLHLSNFGFSIPDAAIIDGITVEIERWAVDTMSVKDNRFRIVKEGTISATDRANTDDFWGDTWNNGYITYGGGSDLWGETWTAADINSSDFGIVLSVSLCGFDPGYNADVDHLRITVSYTEDSTAPAISTLSPSDGASNVATNSNLVIEFDEAIGTTGTGTVSIYETTGDILVEEIDVTSGLVTGSGTDTITINPTSDLDDDTAFYVQIHPNAFPDASGNFFAGIADETTWNFATADETAPAIFTLSPADGATDVAITSDLMLTFDEVIDDTGTGTVSIYKASDDTLVESISVTGSLVTGSGTAIITINPTASLANGTAYYIQIDGNAFPDETGNFFAGIADETTWNFTTVAATPDPDTSDDEDTEEESTPSRGGSRGAGTNRQNALTNNQAEDPALTPCAIRLWDIFDRLEARSLRRIMERPAAAPALHRAIQRLTLRIEERLQDQC